MRRSELRSEIMDACPEGFEDELKDFIDRVEGLVGDIVSELSIKDISDIGNVEDAHRLADDLADSLY